MINYRRCGVAGFLPTPHVGVHTMKKIITFLTLATSLGTVAYGYTGPKDERMSSGFCDQYTTLGKLAQVMDVAAVADVFETGKTYEPDNIYYINSNWEKMPGPIDEVTGEKYLMARDKEVDPAP